MRVVRSEMDFLDPVVSCPSQGIAFISTFKSNFAYFTTLCGMNCFFNLSYMNKMFGVFDFAVT